MSTLFVILSVAYIVLCVALVFVILKQKKRSSGIGTLGSSNGAQTYWDKNKGRSLEGNLERLTKIFGVLLFVFTIVLLVVK